MIGNRLILSLAIPALLALAGCGVPNEAPDAPPQRSALLPLPPMKSFGTGVPAPVRKSNTQIAQDFLELAFALESGRELEVLTKFRGEITVGVIGTAPRGLETELSRLLKRFQREAGIDIRRARTGETPKIAIQAIPRRQLQRAVPNAACFVVPNVTGWNDYRRNRRKPATDWGRIRSRQSATVILPSDVSLQEIRVCLHEEIAQALGPLNDLYRLPDSTFNDDDFHMVLTGFDMLILKTFYSPEIKNGMTRQQVARILPDLLDRLNPRGRRDTGALAGKTPAEWNRAISNALSARHSLSKRATYAERAVAIARKQGWRDNRMAFSLYVQGRATIGSKPDLALQSFLDAGEMYRGLYGNSIQTAHIATQMAAFALSGGRTQIAISFVDDALPAASRAQNAALLSTLLLIKAEALDYDGQRDQAKLVRREGLAWGRFGFGKDETVLERLADIQALVPQRPG